MVQVFILIEAGVKHVRKRKKINANVLYFTLRRSTAGCHASLTPHCWPHIVLLHARIGSCPVLEMLLWDGESIEIRMLQKKTETSPPK